MLTPQQQQFLSSILGQTQQGAAQSYGQFTSPYSPEQDQAAFQKAIIDPSLQQYQQRILPAIQQQFAEGSGGASSALNDALARSATDLTTQLGQGYGQFYQNNQQNRLHALGQLGGYQSQHTYSPLIDQKQGLLGPIISAGAKIGSGAFGLGG
jgi:hypothetical protein